MKLCFPALGIWLVILGLFFGHSVLLGAEYFIDCDASEAGPGTSAAAPLNSFTIVPRLYPGDIVKLKNGTICRGTLNPTTALHASAQLNDSPITFTNYGDLSLNRPEIRGSIVAPIGAWSAVPNRPGQFALAVDSGTRVSELYYANARMPVASNVDSANSEVPVVSKQGGTFEFSEATHDHVGGKVAIRVNAYDWQIFTILSVQNRVLMTSPAFPALSSGGWGYRLLNSLSELDQPGEWVFNESVSKVYFMPPDGSITRETQLTARDFGLRLTPNGGQRIEINNIKFTHQASASISVSYPDLARGTVNVGMVFVKDTLGNGIVLYNAADARVTNSSVERTGRDGIFVKSDNILLQSNVIHSIGVLDGPESTNPVRMAGISANSFDAAIIRENNIWSTYGGGIYVGGRKLDALTLSNNKIRNTCLRTNDCGAIYVNGASQTGGAPACPEARTEPKHLFITDNTIENVLGDQVGAPDKRKLAAGIYLDWGASRALIQRNTVTNARHELGAINVHGGSAVAVLDNTVSQTSYPTINVSYMWNPDGDYRAVCGNLVAHNKVTMANPNLGNIQLRLNGYSSDENYALLAWIHSNTLQNPGAPGSIRMYHLKSPLDSWKNAYYELFNGVPGRYGATRP